MKEKEEPKTSTHIQTLQYDEFTPNSAPRKMWRVVKYEACNFTILELESFKVASK